MPKEIGPVLSPKIPPTDPWFGLLTGHALTLRKRRLDFMYESFLKYGVFMKMKLASRVTYILSHPEAVEWVLKSNAKNYPKNTPGYKKVSDVIGDGVFTDVGEPWKKARKVIQPFFNPKKFDRYRSIVKKECLNSLQKIEEMDLSNPVNISILMTEFTLQVLGQTMFNENLGQFVDVINKDLTTLIHITEDRLNYINPFPSQHKKDQKEKLDKAMASLDGVILDLINQTKKQSIDPDNNFVHAFLESPFEFSDRNLLDQVKTIAFAGHETSANVLSWTFYFLGKYPYWREQINEEVRRVLKDKEPQAEDLEKLPLLNMFIKESMRVRPPAWSFGRLTIEDDIIHGHPIKKDDLITISPYLIHHNPEEWEEPEKFNPLRFSAEKTITPFSYIPFGGGQRVCIGADLAMLEISMILAHFIKNFDLSLPENFKVNMEPFIALRPDKSIKLYLKKV